MQDYRKLKIEKLKYCLKEEKEKELRELLWSWSKVRNYPSGGFNEQFTEVCHGYIRKLIDMLFDEEKRLLMNNQSISKNYFDELQEELLKLTDDEYYEVRCNVYSHCQLPGNEIDPGISIGKVQEKCNSMRNYVKTGVELLQEEFRMGILQPPTGTTIHVRGDVGVINTGIVHGSIQVKIEQLKKSNQIQLAEAFSRLTEAINNSNNIDDEKREQLENVEFLVTQCEIPEGKRNRGIIKSIVKFFSLSNAANIATIWGQVEPIISKYLGIS